MPYTDSGTLVMYAPIREADMSVPLVPDERQREVERCKNERTRREKYLVWKLFEKAVRERFNLDFANLKFTKSENGQWLCPDFYFSLSHTDGAVCVAVSTKPVGVDIEKKREVREGLYARMLTECEREYILTLPSGERCDFFLSSWVRKESLFKRDGGSCLMPAHRETLDSDTRLLRVKIADGEYFIGLANTENEKYEIIYTEEL